jgi:hypothetical protein
VGGWIRPGARILLLGLLVRTSTPSRRGYSLIGPKRMKRLVGVSNVSKFLAQGNFAFRRGVEPGTSGPQAGVSTTMLRVLTIYSHLNPVKQFSINIICIFCIFVLFLVLFVSCSSNSFAVNQHYNLNIRLID